MAGATLKSIVMAMGTHVHHTPKARPGRFCNACSLKDLCLPQLTRRGAVSGYLRKAVDELV